VNDARRGFWRLQIHEVLPSTSDLCRSLAVAGEPAGLAVLARQQTQGRGSRGRDWQSPVGNLYLSVLLRPQQPARDAAQWSLLAGVAVVETLAAYLPADASAGLRLKWPNDVLLHGAKLAGLLIDSSANPAGSIDWLVLGIGVNLAVAPQVPGRATAALAELVEAPALEAFADALLIRLGHWSAVRAAEGFGAVRHAWLLRGPPPGSDIGLRVGAQTLAGGFAGLGEDGSLLLRSGDRVRAFAAGEVLL